MADGLIQPPSDNPYATHSSSLDFRPAGGPRHGAWCAMDALNLHRLHFAFTITYHYLFPQLTMGLALLIFILKTMVVRGNEAANRAARFWTKIFGVTFVMGVITGIPWSFNSAPTGRAFPSSPAASSGRPSPWKASLRSFSSPAFFIC